MTKLETWIKNNVITTIAIILAIITCFFVPIDREYLSYFDYNTLICLFCMLAVVAGLKSTNIFELVSRKMIGLFHTRRAVVYSLRTILLYFLIVICLPPLHSRDCLNSYFL